MGVCDQQHGLHLKIHPISHLNFLRMVFRVATQGYVDSPTVCEEALCFAHVFILNMPYAHRSSNEVRGWFFCEFPLSTTHVLLDVHAASNDQQNAVACSTALSHEDLCEVTSMSSCVGRSELAECPSKYCVARNKSLFGLPINNHGSFLIHEFFQ